MFQILHPVGATPSHVFRRFAPWLVGAGMVLAEACVPVIAQVTPAPPQSSAPAGQTTPQTANPLSTGPVLTPQLGAERQTTEPKRAWTFQPRASLGETLTDNVNPASGTKLADQITEFAAGFRVQVDDAWLKGYADYQATVHSYARGSFGSKAQNALNAFGTYEVVAKQLYIDASGTISQQSISAFGPQVASTAIVSSNRTEVSSFRLSPYLKGKIANAADYEVRYRSTLTDSKSSLTSNSVQQEWSAKLKNSVTKAPFGWSIDASAQVNSYSTGSRSESSRIRSLVSYQVFPDIKLSASVGQEANDYLTINRQSKLTKGYGFDWTPTDRTVVSGFNENRIFGQSSAYSVSHRTPLAAFKFTDTSDVSFLPNQFTTVGLGTIYDLLYAQLASATPDPTARAQQVSNLLAQTGIAPNSQVTSGFMTSRVSLSKRQDISMILNGVRNTVTLAVTRSSQTTLGAAVGLGDFSLASSVTQKGFSGSWAYRLTPLASLTAVLSQQESHGSGATVLGSRYQTATLNYTTRIAAQTNLTMGIRTGAFASNAISYRENAVLATLVARF